MKLIIIHTLYPSYINSFYKKHPQLNTQSYEFQEQTINYDAFGWADFWSHALKESSIQTFELISNNPYLQNAWALERRMKISQANWMKEILIAQVKMINPDYLFFEDRNLDRGLIQELKSVCPNLRKTFGWIGTPFESTDEFSEFDFMIGCIPEINQKLRNANITIYELSHAFDPRILSRLNTNSSPTYPVSFIGQILNKPGMHNKRMEYLSYLAEKTDIKIFSPQYANFLLEDLKHILHQTAWRTKKAVEHFDFLTKNLNRIKVLEKLLTLERPLDKLPISIRQNLLPAKFGLEMFQTLQQTTISFNIHISASKNSASNMRLFEATGVGSCLLTDEKENLDEFFLPHKEVMTYSSPEDCQEKITWLLKNPFQTSKIAKKGQEKTLRCHTFQERAKTLRSILQKER